LTTYPKETGKKVGSTRPIKAAILLTLSLGLLLFSINFPAYRFFEADSTSWRLWFSYARDLIQPFAFYYFLCLAERWLKTWQVRALLALAVPVLLEIGQGLYYRFSTNHYVGSFDPFDILMYTVSVGLAVLLEQRVFAKKIKVW
jgi:hypothetical protein